MKEDEFDELVRRIEAQVMAEAKNALGQKGFDRWRNPRFCGVLEDADSHARVKGVCGDTMEMFIKLHGDRVVEARYRTDGCGSSSVAGSFAAELAHGKTVEEVFDMTGADVLSAIGEFPEAEEHCAYLAVSTLQEAVNSYLVEQTRKSQGH